MKAILKNSILTLSLLAGLSCVKVKNIKVLSDLNLSPESVLADGTSKVQVTVKVNPESAVSKRNVIFKISQGNFAGGANGSITVKADFEDGVLMAKTSFNAPGSPGTIRVWAMPEVDNREDFILTASLNAAVSSAQSIKVSPSSFGLQANFGSEDTIKAVLTNSFGKNVSGGVKVLFEDYYQNQVPAGGFFRNTINASDANSSVITMYTVGSQPAGSFIYVKATVLDAAGNKTSIRDSVKLTIIP